MRNQYFLLAIVVQTFFIHSDQQVVHTSLGSLRGALIQANNGETIEMYKSVPYAAPPLGELRFRPPQNPDKWSGSKDATHYSAACMSNTSVTSSPQKNVSEDCLYLNIFRSQKCTKEHSCPVVVYIHGGALYYDSAVMFPDQHLVDHFASQGVIFCIPGYRMGALGLFATPFEDLTPHNIAIRDILYALKFVKSEIHNFGGNPSNINLMGNSKGADIGLALAFSRKIGNNDPSNMTFHRTMSLSPGMSLMEIPTLYNTSWKFAEKAGCAHGNNEDRSSVEKTLACLRTKTSLELIMVQRAMEDDDKMLFNSFTLAEPIADNPVLVDFLSHPPAVPLLLGATSNEFDGAPDVPGTFPVGDFLQFEHPDIIEKKYFADVYSKRYNPHRVHGSQGVFVTTLNYGTHMAENTDAPVYLYLFNMSIWSHSRHAADLYYLMGIHSFEMNKDEKTVMGFYSELFVNFTKYGQPSPLWEPLSPPRSNYFEICVDSDKGVWPHISENYEQYIVDYWLENMPKFDKTLSQLEANPRTLNIPLNQLEAAGIGTTSLTTYLLLAAIFMLGALMIATVLFRPIEPKKCPPKEQTEISPLLEQVI